MKTGAATVALAAAALLALPATASADDNDVAEAAILGLVGGLIAAELHSGHGDTAHKVRTSGRGYGYNDRHGYGQHVAGYGSKPYNIAMQACSWEAIRRVTNRGQWSAQFVGTPEVTRVDRRLWNLSARMRVIGPNGERKRRINCLVSRGEVVDFGPARKYRPAYRGY